MLEMGLASSADSFVSSDSAEASCPAGALRTTQDQDRSGPLSRSLRLLGDLLVLTTFLLFLLFGLGLSMITALDEPFSAYGGHHVWNYWGSKTDDDDEVEAKVGEA